MKKTKNIKLAAETIKKVLKDKVKPQIAKVPKIIRSRKTVRPTLLKTYALIRLREIFNKTNELFKVILGKHYDLLITFITPLFYYFSYLKPFLIPIWNVTKFVAVTVWAAKMLGVEIPVTLDFLLYLVLGITQGCYLYLVLIWDSLVAMFEQFIGFIKGLIKLIANIIKETQQTEEYQQYLNRNNDFNNPLTKDMKDTYENVKDNESF